MDDTICAMATAQMESGIGIVRISGGRSLEIAGGFVRKKDGSPLFFSKPRYMYYGYVFDIDTGEVLDEVLAVYFKAPFSYTGEDVVEIDCHGGVRLINRVMEMSLKTGARLAEPGEFTKRAFLNGKIDLARAEAVQDLISAESEKAVKASAAQLRGSVSEAVQTYRNVLKSDIAYIEAALDDPEHISLDGFKEKLERDIKDIIKNIGEMIESFREGRIMREGVKAVIVGKPNAGKSSLLNALSGTDRAIVTEYAGTTRDLISEDIRLSGFNLNVIDTAGIRDTDDPVEEIGIGKAFEALSESDLILYVMDASSPLDDSDRIILDRIKGLQGKNVLKIGKTIKTEKLIIILNKSDLPAKITKEDAIKASGCRRVVSMSLKPELKSELKPELYSDLKSKIDIDLKSDLKSDLKFEVDLELDSNLRRESGIRELRDMMEEMFSLGELDFNNQVIITNERHRELLKKCVVALKQVLLSIEADMPEDFFTIDLMDAYGELGKILGLEVSEDIINEIFSKFCLGK